MNFCFHFDKKKTPFSCSNDSSDDNKLFVIEKLSWLRNIKPVKNGVLDTKYLNSNN